MAVKGPDGRVELVVVQLGEGLGVVEGAGEVGPVADRRGGELVGLGACV